MEAMTGNQNGKQQALSPLSNDDIQILTAAIHSLGLPPDQVDMLSAKLTVAANRPADDIVPGWEPIPPLASDETYTFGAGDQKITVQLPILGGDYYWSILLPRLEEWVTGLYRGQALTLLTQAAMNPFPFVMDVFQELVRRPRADRLKISFYETAALTFSRPGAEITPQFFAACPPGQQMGAIRKLVAINQENFIELWAALPSEVKYLITSIRTASMLSIEKLSVQISESIYAMTQETISQLHLNGGHDGTGTGGFTP